MFPAQSELDPIIKELHDSPWRAVIACTGAGAGLQNLLWSVPGASRTVLDAVMPYDQCALADFIGRVPKKYCTRDVALWMATAAYGRARELAIRGGSTKPVLGLGLTAVVATESEKRGGYRVFIAVKTADETMTVSATLSRGSFSREAHGKVCDLLALDAMLAAAGLPQVHLEDHGIISEEIESLPDSPGKFVVRPRAVERFASCITDIYASPCFLSEGERAGVEAIDPQKHVLFWGSFDPLHFGHELMAAQAERMTGKKVVFAIAGSHPDKGIVPEKDLLRRAEQFRWRWPVLFVREASLYVEKARMFPGVGMLIGADVALGILNPKYYGGEEQCAAVLRELHDLNARFYVVGREIEGRFVTLDDLPIPAPLRDLFLPVSGRWDVRSRDLR